MGAVYQYILSFFTLKLIVQRGLANNNHDTRDCPAMTMELMIYRLAARPTPYNCFTTFERCCFLPIARQLCAPASNRYRVHLHKARPASESPESTHAYYGLSPTAMRSQNFISNRYSAAQTLYRAFPISENSLTPREMNVWNKFSDTQVGAELLYQIWITVLNSLALDSACIY